MWSFITEECTCYCSDSVSVGKFSNMESWVSESIFIFIAEIWQNLDLASFSNVLWFSVTVSNHLFCESWERCVAANIVPAWIWLSISLTDVRFCSWCEQTIHQWFVLVIHFTSGVRGPLIVCPELALMRFPSLWHLKRFASGSLSPKTKATNVPKIYSIKSN